MELDFMWKTDVLWYYKYRPVITNLHTLEKASSPKRHHVQNAKIEDPF